MTAPRKVDVERVVRALRKQLAGTRALRARLANMGTGNFGYDYEEAAYENAIRIVRSVAGRALSARGGRGRKKA